MATIEKEKAIDVVKQMVADGQVSQEIAEKYFPELKESEDEKIRKALVEMVHDTTGDELWIDYNVHKEEALAWLEKQGEQKPVGFKPLFRVGDVIKPKDPVLGEPRIIKGIYPKFGYDTNNGILDFEFEDNWELVEQNPAWSEEDEAVLDALIRRLEGEDIYVSPHLAAECIKSLKDRYTWKPSDEQIKALEDAIEFLGCTKKVREDLKSLHEQLKKLREV